MKILLLANADSIHTKKWCIALAERGFEIAVFSMNPTDTLWINEKNIKLFVNNRTKKGEHHLSKIIYLAALPALSKVIRQFKPDIVHAHYATSYGLLGYLSKFKPFYISVWGSDIIDFPRKSFFHKLLLQKILKSSDKLMCSSQYLKRQLNDLVSKEVKVIPFGVDTKLFRPTTSDKRFSGITIGIIKSLEPVYNIPLVIEALNILKNKYKIDNCKLLIVGGGSLESKLKQQVNNLGLGNDVIFTGKVEQNKVVEYHNAIDIFINVSVYESLGVSVLEASACEKPVIATNVGGLCEVVEDNKTGFLIDEVTSEKLAEKILFLINHQEQRTKFGVNGRIYVTKYFEWKQSINQMVNEYLNN